MVALTWPVAVGSATGETSLAGAFGGGTWLAPAPALREAGLPTSLRQPRDSLLVIFNHGSEAEFVADRCAPRGETTPEVVRDLAGARVAGHTVRVFAFCTPSRIGAFHHHSGEGEAKVIARARDIARLVAGFRAAGVPARQIFLFGQSAGAWASLLTAAERPAAIGGVVGFAPAFAGPREERAAGWWALRERLAARIAGARHLPALLFAFPGDRFEPPEDLAFLGGIAGVELRDLAAAPPACAASRPHRTAFTPCFAAAERQTILNFLAARMAAGST